MNNDCNQNNSCPPIILTPGIQGPQGPTGPTGPIGIKGPEGLNTVNNIFALQLQDRNQTYAGGDYRKIIYDEIAIQIGNNVISNIASFPGSGTVTLTAGHVYYITFNTQGYYDSINIIDEGCFCRLILGGQIIPTDGDDAVRWENNNPAFSHAWTYRAQTDTTLEYEISSSSTDFIFSASYLTIMTLV